MGSLIRQQLRFVIIVGYCAIAFCLVTTAQGKGVETESNGNAPASANLKPVMVVLKRPMILTAFQKNGEAEQDKIIANRKKGGWFHVRNARFTLIDSTLQLLPPTATSVKKTGKGNSGWVRAAISPQFIPESRMYAIGFRFKLPKSNQRRSPRFFFESGHHKIVVGGDDSHVKINVFGEIQETDQHALQPERWHRVLFEILGDEVVVRFNNGPAFYANHAKIKDEKERPEIKFGIISTAGIVFDDFGLWTVAPKPAKSWAETKKNVARIRRAQ